MAALHLCLLLSSMLLSMSTSRGCSSIMQDCVQDEDNALMVEVDTRSLLATTDEAFLCATLDWWPPDKCDYGTCAWGQASVLHLVSQSSKLGLFNWSYLLAVL